MHLSTLLPLLITPLTHCLFLSNIPNTCISTPLLQNFRHNRGKATRFCASFLQRPVSTSTIITTVVVQTLTVSYTETTTMTNTATTISTFTERRLTTTTQTITPAPEVTARGMLVIREPDVQFFEEMLQYPEGVLLSACGCLTVQDCVKKTTLTASVATLIWEIETRSVTEEVTRTEGRTVTETETRTVTTVV